MYLILAWMLLFSIGFTTQLNAGTVKYRVADIPGQLLKDAKAVVRNEEIEVDIKSNGKLVQTVTYAITILNKNGKSRSYFMHPYDKHMKVSGIKARLYDGSGNEIKKQGGFKILDYAMISEGSTYDDDRIKAIDPEQYDYPFTIEYTYEVIFSGVLQYPGWYPVKDFNVAVEKSKYKLIVSKAATCRFFEQNISSPVKPLNTSDGTIYKWELTDRRCHKLRKFQSVTF